MPPKKKDAKPTLAETLSKLRKEGTRIGFQEIDAEPEFWSTGNMAIDTICGGGFPKGKIIELAGPEASGKTTTAVSTARNVMEEGGNVVFCDYERAIDKPYFRQLGVDPDSEQFIYLTPYSLEEGANLFRSLLATGEVQYAVFDSVARMATENELTAETGKVMVADRAKMMYQFLRQIVDPLADNNCSVVFLNHLLEKVDITFMGQQLAARGVKQYVTPGGKGLSFFSSLRLFYNKSEDLTRETFNPLLNENSKIKYGSKHKIKVVKNKVGKPGGEAEVTNIMGQGFSQLYTAVDLLLNYGVIKKSGAWFVPKEPRLISVLGDKQIQGLNNVIDAINSTAEAKGTVITVAHELLQQHVDSQVFEEIEETSLPEEFASQSGVFGG